MIFSVEYYMLIDGDHRAHHGRISAVSWADAQAQCDELGVLLVGELIKVIEAAPCTSDFMKDGDVCL